jgi:hypothetical protein
VEKARKEERGIVEAEMEQKIEDAREQARTEAVEAYKLSQEVAAKRMDEINGILPFESEEAKLAAQGEYAGLTDDEFQRVKADREKDKRIAQLEAENAELKSAAKGEPDPEDDKDEDDPDPEDKDRTAIDTGLPSGDGDLQATQEETIDAGAILRNA